MSHWASCTNTRVNNTLKASFSVYWLFSGATDALEHVRSMPSTEFEQTHDGLDWNRIASQVRPPGLLFC